MKKHYIIIAIVVIAALVVLIPEIMRGSNDQPLDAQQETPETLNERIESLGKVAFNSKQYHALEAEIIGYSNSKKIKPQDKDLYFATLHISMQKAAALSFDDFLNQCYSKSLGEVKRIADTIQFPIPALRKAKQTYHQFQRAKRFSYQLNRFLQSKYNDAQANQLQTGFKQCLSGQPFIQCPDIITLKQTLEVECRKFKDFDNNFNLIVIQKKNVSWYDENGPELSKYSYYRTELIKLKNL